MGPGNLTRNLLLLKVVGDGGWESRSSYGRPDAFSFSKTAREIERKEKERNSKMYTRDHREVPEDLDWFGVWKEWTKKVREYAYAYPLNFVGWILGLAFGSLIFLRILYKLMF